jgi:hypothetical protein
MTKDRVNQNQKRTEDMEEEACRRLMILLCGSEEEAGAMGDVLLRYATVEEEEVIKKNYEASRQSVREEGQELNLTPHPGLALQQVNENVSRSPTETEEKEFDAFMQEVYRRAEARMNASNEGLKEPLARVLASGNITKAIELARSTGSAIKEALGRDRITEIWHGLLTVWQPLELAAEGTLADAAPAAMQYFGFRFPIAERIAGSSKAADFDWVPNFLNIMGTHSADGQILSMKVSAYNGPAASQGSGILLVTVSDPADSEQEFVLSRKNRTETIKEPALKGEISDLRISVSLL